MLPKQKTFVASLLCASCFICLVSGCGNPSESGSNSDVANDADSNPETITFERMAPITVAYRNVDQVLDLDQQQSNRFNSLHEKHRKIFENWYANEWQEMRAMNDKVSAWAKSRGRSPKLTAGEEARHKELVAQERAMQKKYEDELLATIPAEKLGQWKAHRISGLLLEFLEPLNLTDEQQSAVRESAPRVLQQLRRQQQQNWRGYGTSKLEQRFGEAIVSADQKPAFEELKNKNKMRMLRWNVQQ